MFTQPKEDIIRGLSVLQKRTCHYLGETCDCKYGIESESVPHSERNGCPELRTAISILTGMSDEAYRKLCSETGLMITE